VTLLDVHWLSLRFKLALTCWLLSSSPVSVVSLAALP
jgi:hypothetical protein